MVCFVLHNMLLELKDELLSGMPDTDFTNTHAQPYDPAGIVETSQVLRAAAVRKQNAQAECAS